MKNFLMQQHDSKTSQLELSRKMCIVKTPHKFYERRVFFRGENCRLHTVSLALQAHPLTVFTKRTAAAPG